MTFHLGIIGGGQLGRMLALAAYPLSGRVRFLEPSADAPMSHLASHIRASYDDAEALQQLARTSDVVTYEFENVPVVSAELVAQHTKIFPPPAALRVSQDRWDEKIFFQSLGIPTPPFAKVDSFSDLQDTAQQLGLPAILKTRRMGYDGKGQFLIRAQHELEQAWETLGSAPLILEAFVNFERELSILAVRGRDGECGFYPLVENHHREGILRLSLAPTPNLDKSLQAQAETLALRVLSALDYVGVLAIELFQCGAALLANEMAPRVHNSGHWTIEGAATSQFENHVRAVMGLPLGSTTTRGASAMLNFIGTLPHTERLLAIPDAHVHLYDKAPRAGRKLGHVTIVAQDPAARAERVAQVQKVMRESET